MRGQVGILSYLKGEHGGNVVILLETKSYLEPILKSAQIVIAEEQGGEMVFLHHKN